MKRSTAIIIGIVIFLVLPAIILTILAVTGTIDLRSKTQKWDDNVTAFFANHDGRVSSTINSSSPNGTQRVTSTVSVTRSG